MAKKVAPTASTSTSAMLSVRRRRRPRSSDTGHQPVAGGPARLDRRGPPGQGQLAPQVPDVDVHQVAARVVVDPPHPAEDALPREHLVGLAQEEGQHVDLARRELYPPAV